LQVRSCSLKETNGGSSVNVFLTASISAVLYLFFGGVLSATEGVTAGAIAGFTAIWICLLRRTAIRSFAASSQVPVKICQAVLAIFPATARVTAVLVRVATQGCSAGKARKYHFSSGRESDPAERTRRAAAVWMASLAPDHFVVALNPDDSEAFLHSILKTERPPDPRWLQ
jgi:hypothetical protein